MYEYSAVCKRVIDGDTLELLIDLGFGILKTDRFRVYGINTAEIRGKTEGERKHAAEAKAFTTNQVFTAQGFPVPLRVITHKDDQDKYGRYLAEIHFATGASLADKLRDSGFEKKESYT